MAKLTMSNKRKPLAIGQMTLSASSMALSNADHVPGQYNSFSVGTQHYDDKTEHFVFSRLDINRKDAERLRDYLNDVLSAKFDMYGQRITDNATD